MKTLNFVLLIFLLISLSTYEITTTLSYPNQTNQLKVNHNESFLANVKMDKSYIELLSRSKITSKKDVKSQIDKSIYDTEPSEHKEKVKKIYLLGLKSNPKAVLYGFKLPLLYSPTYKNIYGFEANFLSAGNFSFSEFGGNFNGLAIGGYKAGAYDDVNGISISGFATVAENFNGVAISCGGAVADNLNGVAIGGLTAVADFALNGIAISGIFTGAENSNGISIGGISAGAVSTFNGMSISGVATVADQFNGIALGGVGTVVSSTFNGIAMSGIVTSAYNFNGLALGSIINYIDKTHNGIQIGLYNKSEKLNGLQLGLYNHTKKLNGIQLGLINVVRDGKGGALPFFPFLNIHF